MTATNPISAEALLQTVQALADDIGARPPGTPAEEEARAYLRGRLQGAGLGEPESLPFQAWRTWGWVTIPSVVISALASIIGWVLPQTKQLGGLIASIAFAELWLGLASRRQMLEPLYPKGYSGTLLTRIAPSGDVRQRVVLIGHTDTNKHRATFSPPLKYLFTQSGGLLVVGMLANALALLAGKGKMKTLHAFATGVLGYAIYSLINDEKEGYVDGANDNASAVALTLGLGIQAHAQRLQHTEVWLAFTGAEEVGLLGTHALLDAYGDVLRDAYFIDIEMVGAGDIRWVEHHSGFAYGTGYAPDADSVRIAQQASRNVPHLNVRGHRMVINEEVRALRQRGFKGICLVGVDEKGWLINWHQYSDNIQGIVPTSLQNAAEFAWAMLHEIDGEC